MRDGVCQWDWGGCNITVTIGGLGGGSPLAALRAAIASYLPFGPGAPRPPWAACGGLRAALRRFTGPCAHFCHAAKAAPQ